MVFKQQGRHLIAEIPAITAKEESTPWT